MSESVDCKEKTTKDIVDRYAEVFRGLGCLEGEYSIQVDKTVKPVVTPCRKISFKLCDKLKAEFDQMEVQKAICTENEPKDWVNGIVTPIKRMGIASLFRSKNVK